MSRRASLSLRTPAFRIEPMEGRLFLSAANHVLILSVDGLHQADLADPTLKQDLNQINALAGSGVTYTNATTTHPSDSFPGTLSYLTGAGPGTTGVFYDDSYDRTLFAPGSNPKTAKPGAEAAYFENLDKNSSLLSGGGDFGANSIDPAKLPIDASGNPVFPNQFLKVNTIFNVAHDAGLFTAFSDKHPAYQLVSGTGGKGLDEFFSPEINSLDALLDPKTGKTVSADALLAANPYTDVRPYKLVDASTDPAGAADPNLEDPTHNLLLVEKYDDLKVSGILNEINGKNPFGTANARIPNLFGMNFQEVSVAQKYAFGGITALQDGSTAPSEILKSAIGHTDQSIQKIVEDLKAHNLWNTTTLVVTAKHGQTPRVGPGGLVADNLFTNILSGAHAPAAMATQDDVSLLWLQDQGRTQAAVAALNAFKANGTVDAFFQGQKVTLPASKVMNQVLSGQGLVNAGLGNPATNSRTPDIIVTLQPGFILVGNPLKFTFKRAEHGGFSENDNHVALIVSGGEVAAADQGKVVATPVHTTQIAVSALQALNLDPSKLQGAVIEHTTALPGLDFNKLPSPVAVKAVAAKTFSDTLVGSKDVDSDLLKSANDVL